MNNSRTKGAKEKPADLWHPHRFHLSPTFMDYLHGDVEEGEEDVACYYEYARESKVLWKAAEERDRLLRRGKWNCEQVVFALTQRTPTRWPCGYLGMEFLMCPSFPDKDWNELNKIERQLLSRFERKRIPPLPTTDVWRLKASGVLDAFRTMGEKAKPVIRKVGLGETPAQMKTVPPVLQWTESIYRVIFDVDFSKTKKQLLNELSVWLDLPEYGELLKKHKKAKIGATGKPLDRLKDLAVWRLYRELHNNSNAAIAFANENRKNFRPFHDARQGQSKKRPRAEADLGSEESYFFNTKKRALNYLAEYIPEEFPASSPSLEAFDKAFLEEYHKADRPALKDF